MKLSILIPAYNEASTILKVLQTVENVKLINNIQKEIIVVNDCSTDNTKELVENYIIENSNSVVLYNHTKNQGKGAA